MGRGYPLGQKEGGRKGGTVQRPPGAMAQKNGAHAGHMQHVLGLVHEQCASEEACQKGGGDSCGYAGE